jgi:hypothetical protein
MGRVEISRDSCIEVDIRFGDCFGKFRGIAKMKLLNSPAVHDRIPPTGFSDPFTPPEAVKLFRDRRPNGGIFPKL